MGQGIVLLRRQRRQTKRRGIALPHTGDDRLDRRAELPLFFLCQSPQKQDERLEKAAADVFLIPDALFFIFVHHVPDDVPQLAAVVVKNSAGGGGLETAVLKMQQIGVRHLAERVTVGEGAVDELRIENEIEDEKRLVAVRPIGVARAVVHDEKIPRAHFGGLAVQKMRCRTAQNIGKFQKRMPVQRLLPPMGGEHMKALRVQFLEHDKITAKNGNFGTVFSIRLAV